QGPAISRLQTVVKATGKSPISKEWRFREPPAVWKQPFLEASPLRRSPRIHRQMPMLLLQYFRNEVTGVDSSFVRPCKNSSSIRKIASVRSPPTFLIKVTAEALVPPWRADHRSAR